MNDIRPQRQWERHFNSLSPAEKEEMTMLVCGIVSLIALANASREQARIDRTAAKVLESVDI